MHAIASAGLPPSRELRRSCLTHCGVPEIFGTDPSTSTRTSDHECHCSRRRPRVRFFGFFWNHSCSIRRILWRLLLLDTWIRRNSSHGDDCLRHVGNVQYCRRCYSASSTNLPSTVCSWVGNKMDFWDILFLLRGNRRIFWGWRGLGRKKCFGCSTSCFWLKLEKLRSEAENAVARCTVQS
jgi:hypothetical protein